MGETLHTLQDFYSHSNWVNIINKTTGELSDFTINFDDIDIAKLGEVIILSPNKDTFFATIGNTSESIAEARMCTWQTEVKLVAESNDAIIYNFFGGILTPTNKYRDLGLTEITSGYFEGLGVLDPPVFKCDHGLKVLGVGFSETRGINKDTDEQPHFLLAFNAAKASTKYIVERILDTDGIKGNEEVIRDFLDQAKAKSGSLGFVVDTTGSMGSTITGIKNAINDIITKIETDDDVDVTSFLVMSYGDPDLGDPEVADTPAKMRELVNAITLGVPNGGGDFPERTYAALQKAIEKASNGSTLYVYTDASTKETELASAIKSSANNKNIQIVVFVSNPSIQSEYLAITDAVNVKPYEHTVAGAESTVNSIQLSFAGDSHLVVAISDSTATSGAGSTAPKSDKLNIVTYTAPDGNSARHYMPVDPNVLAAARTAFKTVAKEYPVNVDASVTSMSISINMAPLGEVKLFRPNGVEAVASDADVDISTSSVSEFIIVTAPVVGEWKLTIAGDEGVAYDVDVKMNTDIHFVSFNFAEEKGRPGHTGLFPIDGQPLVSGTQSIISTFSGEISTVELVLISLKGEELKKITLTELDKTSSAVRYFGEIDLPTESFRVRAQGTDKDGNPFERIYPVVYKGQSVSITTEPTPNKMVRGTTYSARFVLKNTGLADTFKLEATDTSSYFQSINITEITLGTDDSKVIEVILNVPLGALDGEIDTVTLTATSIINTDSTNSGSSTFTVNDDGDGDGVPDTVEKGDSGVYDGNSDGTPDYLQTGVASFYAHDSSLIITFEIIGNGNLSLVKGIPSPDPDTEPSDIDFPLNLFDFKIEGLANGETTKLKIHYNGSLNPNKYYKYGPTTTLAIPHWYEFTDVVFDNGSVTLTLKDGADGDDDLLENGIIIDAGGLAFLKAEDTSTEGGGGSESSTGDTTTGTTTGGNGNTVVVTTSGGAVTVTANDAGVIINQVTAVGDGSALIQSQGGTRPDDVTFPYGFISYQITNVTPGGTVTVNITYPSIPENATFYKVDSTNGFVEFTGFSISGNTATITLTDGGIGDADGVVNGVIDDPIGLGSRTTTTTPVTTTTSSGGGSIDPIGILLFLMLLFLQALRKKRI